MKSDSSLAYYRSRVNRYAAILLFLIAGLGAAAFKIQMYVSIGRYQHYAIALFLIGLGFIVQVIWSWRLFTKWDRISHLASGAFILAIATIFYSNPWLDERMSAQTAATDSMRYVLLGYVGFFSLLVSIVWLKALNEDKKLRSYANPIESPKS